MEGDWEIIERAFPYTSSIKQQYLLDFGWREFS